MSHQCPGPDCQADVDDSMLMCRPHWYSVPLALRNAVWRAWQSGRGAGSDEHNGAIVAAIESIGGHS